MNNRLTVNAGVTTTVNLANLATNINAGTTMNLNLAPSVTYQVADTLTTGPGRVYSANRTYNTVGLDSIKFVAGLDGAERTKCLAGWKGLTFAAATLLGMAASIVPATYNHFSPEDRLGPQQQVVGAYAASSLSFLFYWINSRACDEFDMAVPEDRDGRPIPYDAYDAAPGRFGGTLMTLNEFGLTVLGSRKISGSLHLKGADREGTRPVIKVGNGDVTINAEEASLPNGTQLLSRILMSVGSVFIEGGAGFTTASLDVNEIRINRQQRTIIMDDGSLRLGTNADKLINPAMPGQCMVMITDNAVEATGEAIRLQASGTEAILDANGAMISSATDYVIRLRNGQGISINGRRLDLDADSYLYLG